MYCPVYGCTSDSKKNPGKGLHFFSFPGSKTHEQLRNRRKVWIEFCKRKAFTKPSPNTKICSLHFAEDAYDPAHSPKFLKSIGCQDQTLVLLKNHASPTLNKPMEKTATKQRKLTEKRRRRKVIRLCGLLNCTWFPYIVFPCCSFHRCPFSLLCCTQIYLNNKQRQVLFFVASGLCPTRSLSQNVL